MTIPGHGTGICRSVFTHCLRSKNAFKFCNSIGNSYKPEAIFGGCAMDFQIDFDIPFSINVTYPEYHSYDSDFPVDTHQRHRNPISNATLVLLFLYVISFDIVVILVSKFSNRKKRQILRSQDQYDLVSNNNYDVKIKPDVPHFAVFLAYSHNPCDLDDVKTLYRLLITFLRQFLSDWPEERLILLNDKDVFTGHSQKDIWNAAIHDSHVTVPVVSDSFIKSSRCQYLLKQAVKSDVPIIPLYATQQDITKLKGILKYVYNTLGGLFWPLNGETTNDISDEELERVENLAINIAAQVKQRELSNHAVTSRTGKSNILRGSHAGFTTSSDASIKNTRAIHKLTYDNLVRIATQYSSNYRKILPGYYTSTLARVKTPHFAVFLAYSHNDCDFVVRKLYRPLIRFLRQFLSDWPENRLTLLYDKDFLAGQYVKDTCKAAVQESHVTVPVVSDSFINSIWCQYELEEAVDAGVPIIPLYISQQDARKQNGVLKDVLTKCSGMFWPQNDVNTDNDISEEELGRIKQLAFDIAGHVKRREMFDQDIAMIRSIRCEQFVHTFNHEPHRTGIQHEHDHVFIEDPTLIYTRVPVNESARFNSFV